MMKSFFIVLLILTIGRPSLSLPANFMIKFQALKPRGLSLSFPDGGFKSVAFNGNLNHSGYTKQWYLYAPRPTKNWWILEDHNMNLNLGDIIHYEIKIISKNGVSSSIRGDWTVTEFSEDKETPSCVISSTEVQCGRTVCSGSLIFSEYFGDSGIIDLKQWQLEKYYPQEPDYPFNVYLSEAVTTVYDGTLKIKAVPTAGYITDVHIDKSADLNNILRCTGEIITSECYRTSFNYYTEPPVVSGKLTTRKTFNFKYGKVEVRAKLPRGKWLIPEISLEPRDHEYGKLHFGSGIIRIAFSKENSDQSYNFYGGPVVHDQEPYRSMFLIRSLKGSSWNDDFHTYSVIWAPDNVQMLVDGEFYGYINTNKSNYYNLTPREPSMKMQNVAWKQGGSNAPFDKLFYISLGLRVGGIHDFLDSDDKPWKNKSPKAMHAFATRKTDWYSSWTSPELVVDYVKVYAL